MSYQIGHFIGSNAPVIALFVALFIFRKAVSVIAIRARISFFSVADEMFSLFRSYAMYLDGLIHAKKQPTQEAPKPVYNSVFNARDWSMYDEPTFIRKVVEGFAV